MIPTLEAFHEMNALKLSPTQVQKILSQAYRKNFTGDVYSLINGEYDFEFLAAAKLQAKKAFLQHVPMLFQILLTEPVMTDLQQKGKKVNVDKLVDRLFEMTGIAGEQDIIGDMTAEDKAAFQQQQQMQLQMMQSKQDMQTQAKIKVLEANNDARVGRDIIREGLKHQEQGTFGS
jgi:hypothetical protein